MFCLRIFYQDLDLEGMSTDDKGLRLLKLFPNTETVPPSYDDALCSSLTSHVLCLESHRVLVMS